MAPPRVSLPSLVLCLTLISNLLSAHGAPPPTPVSPLGSWPFYRGGAHLRGESPYLGPIPGNFTPGASLLDYPFSVINALYPLCTPGSGGNSPSVNLNAQPILDNLDRVYITYNAGGMVRLRPNAGPGTCGNVSSGNRAARLIPAANVSGGFRNVCFTGAFSDTYSSLLSRCGLGSIDGPCAGMTAAQISVHRNAHFTMGLTAPALLTNASFNPIIAAAGWDVTAFTPTNTWPQTLGQAGRRAWSAPTDFTKVRYPTFGTSPTLGGDGQGNPGGVVFIGGWGLWAVEAGEGGVLWSRNLDSLTYTVETTSILADISFYSIASAHPGWAGVVNRSSGAPPLPTSPAVARGTLFATHNLFAAEGGGTGQLPLGWGGLSALDPVTGVAYWTALNLPPGSFVEGFPNYVPLVGCPTSSPSVITWDAGDSPNPRAPFPPSPGPGGRLFFPYYIFLNNSAFPQGTVTFGVGAVDARTGAALWSSPLPLPNTPPPQGTPFNLPSIITPLAVSQAHGWVFATDTLGWVWAWDAWSGAELWRAPGANRDTILPFGPNLRLVTSPVVDAAGRVYVVSNGDELGWVTCYEGGTGEVLWKVPNIYRDWAFPNEFAGQVILSSPALSSDGWLYFGGPCVLYGIGFADFKGGLPPPSASPSVSPSSSLTPSPTPSPTGTPSLPPTPTGTPSQGASLSQTPSPTDSPDVTRTPSPSPSPTPSPTQTKSATITPINFFPPFLASPSKPFSPSPTPTPTQPAPGTVIPGANPGGAAALPGNPPSFQPTIGGSIGLGISIAIVCVVIVICLKAGPSKREIYLSQLVKGAKKVIGLVRPAPPPTPVHPVLPHVPESVMIEMARNFAAASSGPNTSITSITAIPPSANTTTVQNPLGDASASVSAISASASASSAADVQAPPTEKFDLHTTAEAIHLPGSTEAGGRTVADTTPSLPDREKFALGLEGQQQQQQQPLRQDTPVDEHEKYSLALEQQHPGMVEPSPPPHPPMAPSPNAGSPLEDMKKLPRGDVLGGPSAGGGGGSGMEGEEEVGSEKGEPEVYRGLLPETLVPTEMPDVYRGAASLDFTPPTSRSVFRFPLEHPPSSPKPPTDSAAGVGL